MTTRRFLGSALTAFVFLSCSFVAICATNFDGEIKGDAQLRAMLAELARAKTLQLNNLEKPYFVSFASGDSEQAVIAASLGGLTTSNFARVRQPQVEVRVGSYAFDNTNSIYSRSQRGGLLPLDDDVQAMRTSLWLSADSLYKSAV